jgi:hypothetical protein
MSIASIFSSAFASSTAQLFHRPSQQSQQEFQQLGQDLKAGNLSAAQTDFATLQQLNGQTTGSTNTNNPIAQAFQQLSQDLQSGNLSAAQQALSSRISITARSARTIIIITGARSNRTRSISCFSSWDRSCNRATCQRRSRHTARCHRICNGSALGAQLRRRNHRSQRAASR